MLKVYWKRNFFNGISVFKGTLWWKLLYFHLKGGSNLHSDQDYLWAYLHWSGKVTRAGHLWKKRDGSRSQFQGWSWVTVPAQGPCHLTAWWTVLHSGECASRRAQPHGRGEGRERAQKADSVPNNPLSWEPVQSLEPSFSLEGANPIWQEKQFTKGDTPGPTASTQLYWGVNL